MHRLVAIPVVVAALGVAMPAAAATATVRLGSAKGGLRALAASGELAYGVLGVDAPFRLVRSTGAGAHPVAVLGPPAGEDPDLAVGGGGLLVAWGRRTSLGQAYESAEWPRGDAAPLGTTLGAGPARLAVDGDDRLLAFTDPEGNAMLARAAPGAEPTLEPLSADAPVWRHVPLDIAVDGGVPFVLDRAQTRGRSELRVRGPQAPRRAVVMAGGLHDLDATLAVADGRVYVAYLLRGRAWLAHAAAAPTGRWSRRRLPGLGGGEGAPAVIRPGGATLVAYSRREGRQREIFLATIGPAGLRERQVSRSPGDDTAPHIAATPTGRVYVGWSRRASRRSRVATGMLQRVR